MAEAYTGRGLFDVASFARRGPGRRDRLTPSEIEQVRRTAARVPEVMVKVLTRGSNSSAQVARHVEYIGRKGDVELETDDGRRLTGDDVGRELVEDWDLDLPDGRSAERAARGSTQQCRATIWMKQRDDQDGRRWSRRVDDVAAVCRWQVQVSG